MDYYKEKGLHALANVIHVDKTGWFHGHIGASLITGAYLLESGLLSSYAETSLQARLDIIIESYSDYFQPITRSCFTDIMPIEKALNACTKQQNLSGYGFIYGTLALRVLHQFPELADSNITNAIAQLIHNCQKDKWAKYYDLNNRHNYQSISCQTITVFDICQLAVEKSAQPMFINSHQPFFTGEKIHGLTHAYAIYQLNQLGYEHIAHDALKHTIKQLEFAAHTSGTTITAEAKAINLHDPAIWNEDCANKNQLKLAYSFCEMALELTLDSRCLHKLWEAISTKV
ncbi:hypothetical protein MHO82_14430 [Vibrio sp. Of7-15]|uniref:hypothetical protein n=1 Tax=Vibrio sp. Of7-15 TaxID=2724879 RepID=UPI001EF37A8B|nr:hypothetical protein [Vibrio sp. Of7-15]MCG7498064.1 hypothetical protein [Vibrio sp. Of7-15]